MRYTSAATTYLRVDRRGDRLVVMTSSDGRLWSTLKDCSIAGFPPLVQVGVAAINSGTSEFAPRFEGWSLQPSIPTTSERDAGMEPPVVGRDLGPWGRLVDPLGVSMVARDGDRLTIATPDRTSLDLNPMPDHNLDAPRTLQAVEGDFIVEVKVLNIPKPMLDANATPDDKIYQWAGLVLWANERNFLRFGNSRSSVVAEGRPWTSGEFFRDADRLPLNEYTADEGPMYFRAIRRGNTLFLKNSGDGKVWYDYKTHDLTGLPTKLQVGVGAISTGVKGFRSQFEGWSLQPSLSTFPRSGQNLGPWGRLVDPVGGSRATRDGDRLTMALPARSSRGSNPVKAWEQSQDAPRVFGDVEGDFEARVTLLPFPAPPAGTGAVKGSKTSRWSGLVVADDGRDLLRFGVTRDPNHGDGVPLLDLRFRRNQNNQKIESDVRYAPDGPIHVLFLRRGKTFRLRTSPDGKTWSSHKTGEIDGWPRRVQLGIAAINSGMAGSTFAFERWSLRLLGSPDPALPWSRPETSRELGPWGRLVDPLGVSRVMRDGDRLTIAVPDEAPLDLNPGSDHNLDAPRVLQEVNGDFVVQVKMLGLPDAQPDLGVAVGGKFYHWAGLVFWANERDFLRFGNARNSDTEDGRPFTESEFFLDSNVLAGDRIWTDKGPIFLRAERRGNTLELSNSSDGQLWHPYKTTDLTGLPAKIYVGVSLVNTGTKAYQAQFEGWSLQSDSAGGGGEIR